MPYKDPEKGREYHNNYMRLYRRRNPEYREYVRKYDQKPEVKERKREHMLDYSHKPEVKERKREYYQQPEVKERKRAQKQKKLARSNGIPPNLGYCYACLVKGEPNSGPGRGLSVDHCHLLGDVNRGYLCTLCNTMEGFYAKGKLGPRAVMPDHLVVYLRRFGQGWHVGTGLEELKTDLRALGLEIKDVV